MMPSFFGSSQRRLFGVYSPAHAGRARPRAVVLCYPWGQEYLRAHRSMRQLASNLAAEGYHVLRFDYFGTGDSAGDMLDMTLRDWERDIETAMEELQDSSGVTKLALVGLRLGASLAARVAVRSPKVVDTLVLWDPIVNGAQYVQELYVTEATQHRKGPRSVMRPEQIGGGREILGFPLSRALTEEVSAVDLLGLVPELPARTSVIYSLASPALGAFEEELKKRDRAGWAIEHIESPYAWLQYQDLGAGATPARVLERIVRRLE